MDVLIALVIALAVGFGISQVVSLITPKDKSKDD
jgi:hypothetical protein